MPNEICNLNSLEKLTISSDKLKKIPKKLGDLPNIKEITIIVKKIKKIPNEIYDKVEFFNVFETYKFE